MTEESPEAQPDEEPLEDDQDESLAPDDGQGDEPTEPEPNPDPQE